MRQLDVELALHTSVCSNRFSVILYGSRAKHSLGNALHTALQALSEALSGSSRSIPDPMSRSRGGALAHHRKFGCFPCGLNVVPAMSQSCNNYARSHLASRRWRSRRLLASITVVCQAPATLSQPRPEA